MIEPPAGRSTPAEIAAESGTVRAQPLASVLDVLQGLIAVLNGRSEVVFANQAFREFTGRTAEELRGLRLGEMLRCRNAEDGRGCGESPRCAICGNLDAITSTRRTYLPSARECSMSVAGGETSARDFVVRTVPFDIDGSPYILMSMWEISGQKRRAALERIFFHDILNTAAGIKVYVDLLKAGIADDPARGLITRIEAMSNALVEEIESQRLLLSAENRTLSTRRDLIVSHAIVEQVVHSLESQEAAQGKRIIVAPFSESFSLVSDGSLLTRVLGNMLRNALEASPAGATVTLGFRKEGETARFWVHNPGHMAEDVRRQVFQRYFSTKGKDRGLGTYSMKLLTEEYLAGSICMESTPEAGTTFCITLPGRA
jgi:hypothetical protein